MTVVLHSKNLIILDKGRCLSTKKSLKINAKMSKFGFLDGPGVIILIIVIFIMLFLLYLVDFYFYLVKETYVKFN